MKLTSLRTWGARAEAPDMARSVLGEMGKVLPWAVLEALIVRPTGLKTQVREDLLDHRLLKDRRDDLQLATAVRAVLHGLHAFVGQRRAGDVAAELLKRLAVVGAATHGSVQA